MHSKDHHHRDGDDNTNKTNNKNLADLSLSLRTPSSKKQKFTSPPASSLIQKQTSPTNKPYRTRRPPPSTKPTTELTIPPPFPWSTSHPCKIHSLHHLTISGILTISGSMQCKNCTTTHSINLNLHSKFSQLSHFIRDFKHSLHHRAPLSWMKPPLPPCTHCNATSSLAPLVPSDKTHINWLFLLLSQTLGLLTLKILKYFSESNGFYLTGSKDRLVYSAYLALCKQLDPSGPFDMD